MKSDYPYLIVIVVLFVMLIGSNIQYQAQISLLRAEIQLRDDILMTTMAMMNRRMTDLRAYIIRVEKHRDYLLGLWARNLSKEGSEDPRGMKTFD